MTENNPLPFYDLEAVATHLREKLDNDDKKYQLLFAHNGIGKTRLSMAFKEEGKRKVFRSGGEFSLRQRYRKQIKRRLNKDACRRKVREVYLEDISGDTLYFNAFTEDLFTWDNDLENDTQRVLMLNTTSQFFTGFEEMEMETRMRELLKRYSDFGFTINTENWTVRFTRKLQTDDIKISRGEENIFIWCFFLTAAQLAVDAEEGQPYYWVNYLYIDDPISSLDDNNAIAVACHLAQLLEDKNNKRIKTVISSHHALFFNVMCNALEREKGNEYMLGYDDSRVEYTLTDTRDTPYFHHVVLLKQLHEAVESGNLYTYHFNILRNILEKTAAFHGFKHFSACINQDDDDPEGIVHARMINLLSHGNYSLFEPVEMGEENKQVFKTILDNFMDNYRFNLELFPKLK